MAIRKIVKRNVELVIRCPEYEKLMAHLFPGDDDEHGAVILAGLVDCEGGTKLLVRDVILAVDGVDYVPGQRGYRMLKAEFIHTQIDRCVESRLIYLAVHNHRGSDRVGFSKPDMQSHERGYPALIDILDGLPVGALVFAKHAIAGDIWNPDGARVSLERAIIVGPSRKVLRSMPKRSMVDVDPKYDRQVRIFGKLGQDILAKSNVAVIGVGGVGSILVELLSRLGVGHLTLIDPDHVEITNLPRLIGATHSDVHPGALAKVLSVFMKRKIPTMKVDLASRIAKKANSKISLRPMAADYLHEDVARSILDADYIFLAADTNQARLLFNATVHQYLIPGSQIGSKITHDKDTGELVDVFSAVRPLSTYTGCLLCNGLIDTQKLAEESLTEEDRRRQRYTDEVGIVSPSVMALNALGASRAVNQFMLYMTGQCHSSADYVIEHLLTNEVELCEPRQNSDCSECGPNDNSRVARGDLMDLPTKVAS